jgi:hypothetical protein
MLRFDGLDICVGPNGLVGDTDVQAGQVGRVDETFSPLRSDFGDSYDSSKLYDVMLASAFDCLVLPAQLLFLFISFFLPCSGGTLTPSVELAAPCS